MMKVCTDCQVEKPLDDFHNKAKNKDGKFSHCKECANRRERKRRADNLEHYLEKEARDRERNRERNRAYSAKYRNENREKFLEICRRSKERNPKKHLLNTAKRRANERGWEFSITEQDIDIPDVCPALGIPIEKKFGERRHLRAPSIDRIDNDKGYVPGNVKVISYRANIIKGIGTAEEHEMIAKWMRSIE